MPGILQGPCHGSGTGAIPSDRVFGVELQVVERSFLSARVAAGGMAPVLRDHLRYRRGQQHVLSPPRSVNVRGVAGTDTRVIPDGRQGEPVSHPHEAAARSCRADPPFVFSCVCTEWAARPDTLSAAGQLPDRLATARTVPRCPSETREGATRIDHTARTRH